jgi:hypothetical protein
MATVTVDLADLETIIFATGVIKTIEGALASRTRDPFVQPHLDYTAAHDRLAAAMRNARRAESGTLVGWDEPLTKEEMGALRYVSAALEQKVPGIRAFVISPEDKGEPGRAMSVYDRLAAKGCLKMGQFVQGIVWAGENAPQLVADEKGYAALITPCGYDKLGPKTGETQNGDGTAKG